MSKIFDNTSEREREIDRSGQTEIKMNTTTENIQYIYSK